MFFLTSHSLLPMGIHRCIEKCALGETYFVHHKAYKDHWDLIIPEVTLITCTNLQLEATAVSGQSRLLDSFLLQLCHFPLLNVWGAKEKKCTYFQFLSIVHAKVANSNPTNYVFLRSAINTALEEGQVIWIIRVIWVTFFPGQVGLIHFIEYLGLTRMSSRVTIS